MSKKVIFGGIRTHNKEVAAKIDNNQKVDFGGIRTHAQKTAALTQRLRPLGHEVSTSDTGTRTPVWNVRGSCDNHLHYIGLDQKAQRPATGSLFIIYNFPLPVRT